MFAYTSLSLPINIRKKNCTFISMGNATQNSCKKTNKTTSNIKKSLKYVKACCSDPELSADQRKRQTWFTTLLREKERDGYFFTPAFQQKFSKPSCINYLLHKKLSNTNNLNKPASPLKIFITSIN